ncbi:transcription factor bHLH123 [Neltuma alba]|nr:transcription factor bHLH123-like [Prosopis alba]
MLQENLGSQESGMGLSHHQQVEWREKLLFSTDSSSTTTEQYSTTSGDSIVTTSQGLACSFHMDSNSYSAANPSILQGILAPEASSSSSSFDNNHNRACFNNFPYGSNNNDQLMASNWPKVSQFLRASPPKQTQHHGGGCGGNSQLQFTNNTTFWNASEAPPHHHHQAAIKEPRASFFPSLQPPFHSPNFDAQSKNICGGRETNSVGKKSGGEAAPKRARNETSSTLPPFKVRKEKMGDRITALQQLVSPFGKTDTASVLSEAIEYIKFLHEQVSVLSTPYMKSGAPQHQQSSGKCKDGEALKQDLRSRGLCLVPVSSTFPVTHETTVDFWMPTFGATFR